MIIVSFDPGKEASWAKHDTRFPEKISLGSVELAGVGRFMRPCSVHISEIISDADIVLVEEVSSRPHEGVVSSFTFGMAFGSILSAVTISQKALRTVTPNQWSSVLRLAKNTTQSEKKKAGLRYARELWPENREDLRLEKDHGKADAALMIKWWLEKGPGKDL